MDKPSKQIQDKLFKCVMRDSSKYYEYSQPEIWIGNELVLHDNKNTPDAKTRKEVDKQGKTITKKLNSGKFGQWNEFNGWFTVKRTSDKRAAGRRCRALCEKRRGIGS